MEPTDIHTEIITFFLGGWLGLRGAGALLSVLHRGPLPAPLQAAPRIAGGWVANVVCRLLSETISCEIYNFMVSIVYGYLIIPSLLVCKLLLQHLIFHGFLYIIKTEITL